MSFRPSHHLYIGWSVHRPVGLSVGIPSREKKPKRIGMPNKGKPVTFFSAETGVRSHQQKLKFFIFFFLSFLFSPLRGNVFPPLFLPRSIFFSFTSYSYFFVFFYYFCFFIFFFPASFLFLSLFIFFLFLSFDNFLIFFFFSFF